jgi:uncharacterized protein YdiU (UPF0061 family)
MGSADTPRTALADPVQPAELPAVFPFANSYARLPNHFYARLNPMPVAAPRLLKLNVELARNLGLDPAELASHEGIEILAGNRIAEGSEPLAIAYAGHQFGHFVPSLGDGRANLLGEVFGQDGVRYDLQLKGSGPTPFSRRGDGRAALGPVLREYIVSEAMAAMGVPTTRALAAVATGELVVRERMQPGAILTRVAASHLRVGTFQYFAARRDIEALRVLAAYALARHYPDKTEAAKPLRAFLESVISRHADLVAQWLCLGFIHGVMNTDNTSISGETLDFGPCAFMEAYDPATVFSAIDVNGRYAYGNQPQIALWNLTRLAESLLPLLAEEEKSEEAGSAAAKEALAAFSPRFHAAHTAGLRRKLGLTTNQEGDALLAEDLLTRMTANRADFTLTFRHLCNAAENPECDQEVRALFVDPAAYDEWARSWRSRTSKEPVCPAARAAGMRTANPAFIPRNHLVEEALAAAAERQDLQPFETLLDVVLHPWDDRDDRPDLARYARPATKEQRVSRTFCGT